MLPSEKPWNEKRNFFCTHLRQICIKKCCIHAITFKLSLNVANRNKMKVLKFQSSSFWEIKKTLIMWRGRGSILQTPSFPNEIRIMFVNFVISSNRKQDFHAKKYCFLNKHRPRLSAAPKIFSFFKRGLRYVYDSLYLFYYYFISLYRMSQNYPINYPWQKQVLPWIFFAGFNNFPSCSFQSQRVHDLITKDDRKKIIITQFTFHHDHSMEL